MLNKKPSSFLVLLFVVFFFTIISLMQKSKFLSQENKLSELNYEIQNYKDVISELNIEISKLSLNSHIIELAESKLNMVFPKPEDIYCVQKQRISRDDFQYSFLNFFAPEAIAADK